MPAAQAEHLMRACSKSCRMLLYHCKEQHNPTDRGDVKSPSPVVCLSSPHGLCLGLTASSVMVELLCE